MTDLQPDSAKIRPAQDGDSALLDKLVARRREIRRRLAITGKCDSSPAPKQVPAALAYATKTYIPTAPVRPYFPPLPPQNIKPLSERLADADLFRGELSLAAIRTIKETIQKSARDCGETNCKGVKASPVWWMKKIGDIQKLVADRYSVDVEEMIYGHLPRNIQRHRNSSRTARKIAMYLSRRLTRRSLSEIGRVFGGRDHATVLHAVQGMERLMKDDHALAAEVAELCGVLGE